MRVDSELGAAAGNSLQRRSRRRQKKGPPMPTAIMRLFRACKEVFPNCGAGIVPRSEEVAKIQSVLDKIKPTDVNVTPNMFRNVKPFKGKLPVTYLHLYECDNFSIGIFILPPSAVIPLHNHPEMTVFSKILYGSMHIKSYDWVDVPEEPNNNNVDQKHFQPPGVRLAEVKADAVYTAPCAPSILYPNSGGNMHCFTAVTSCAVLDVLGPPYSDSEGRHCTYYNVFPFESFSDDPSKLAENGEKYAWLEAREKPDDFYVVGANYTGPRIVDSS